MTGGRLRDAVWGSIRATADRLPYVVSTTLAGSFADSGDPAGTSDIDLIVLVDRLSADRFEELKAAFRDAVGPPLAAEGLDLVLNPTLGPLKFDTPGVAVLHLMVYTLAGHVDHAVQSPFTCLDWQRAGHTHGRSLFDAYPVFGLQPRHFFGARRSATEYLREFRAGVVSYRELECDAAGHREVRQSKPMTPRDRHEFAYHVLKFLMGNLLKLVTRENIADSGTALLDRYFAVFPDGRDLFGPLFLDLARRKAVREFDPARPDLGRELEAFVAAFERQFRGEFHDRATRHLAFRHAATPLNGRPGNQRIFLGRSNPDILPIDPPGPLVTAAAEVQPVRGYVSPANRCRKSYALLPLPEPTPDDRLWEIDYGRFEGHSIAEAEKLFPEVFAAWQRGEDPQFPGGENSADVATRIAQFADERFTHDGNTVTCTHNGVLRAIVGTTLGVPRRQWVKLVFPHLGPITMIRSRRFGLFVDLPEEVERAVFAGFAPEMTLSPPEGNGQGGG
ncbi:MAG TPA: histidine phosphatase family protein [Fimbriiglobus sp.]|jgi:broad specificity phosphatase PhoE